MKNKFCASLLTIIFCGILACVSIGSQAEARVYVRSSGCQYDHAGFPIFGYIGGRAVYGYSPSGRAIFVIGNLTPHCRVPHWRPAPYYRGCYRSVRPVYCAPRPIVINPGHCRPRPCHPRARVQPRRCR